MIMTTEEIKTIIGTLARSQGRYGRLYQQIEENDLWDHITAVCDDNGVHDAVDFIMFLEG